ncbi:MAG: hypothetical protein JST30_16115 [Armatimonadetes bacterium]|nr:hypothetical protein [Armatimonadota bacterium]
MFGLTLLTDLLGEFNRGKFETDELILTALIPSIIAVIVFYAGMKLQHLGKPKFIKWTAVVALLVGVFLGMEPFRMMFFDTTYQQMYPGGGKTKLMHAGGVIMPVLTLIGLAFWSWWNNRQRFEEL